MFVIGVHIHSYNSHKSFVKIKLTGIINSNLEINKGVVFKYTTRYAMFRSQNQRLSRYLCMICIHRILCNDLHVKQAKTGVTKFEILR